MPAKIEIIIQMKITGTFCKVSIDHTAKRLEQIQKEVYE
jgi:hypothetical protein